jgi:cysteine desulfurase family protein (TIGR01976 family)
MTFPISWIREQFPALKQDKIFLDNPAGTQVPQQIVDAISEAIIYKNANLGGYFQTSHDSLKNVDDAHEAMADLFGTDNAEEIIIGPSMTNLTFAMSRTLGKKFQAGDEIIVTRMDHEGNIAPWLHMAEDYGLHIKFLEFNHDSFRIEAEDLQQLITDKTRLLALNYASNMTGSINDVAGLCHIAKAHALMDVKAQADIDFMVCSSYKFCGPHLGILWGKKALLQSLSAYKCRTVGEELPSKFETGTPQLELLAGLTASVDYLASLAGNVNGISRREALIKSFHIMQDYEAQLARHFIHALQEIKGVRILGITSDNHMMHRVPTISFVHEETASQDIAKYLAQSNIQIWSGHNYALEQCRSFGLKENDGVVRVGPVHYNNHDELNKTIEAIDQAIRLL